jgi:hypothetical protein
MDAATIALKQADNIGILSSLASQYGPFFFSILFVLFVPVFGQRWFFKLLQTRAAGTAAERAKAMSVYKFYWTSGIVTGLILVGFSVSWWAFVQYRYTLSPNEEQFNKRVSNEISKRIFQGVIRGADDEDIFVYDFNNPQYSIYIYPLRNQRPMLVRFVIVFNNDPVTNERIHILYMNKKSYELLASNSTAAGYRPTPLEFCINRAASDMTFIKDDTRPPHFDIVCGENKS